MPPKMRAPLERMPEGGGRRGDTCAHPRERLSATLVPPANALRGAAHRDKNTPCRRLFLLRNLSAVYERLQQVIVVNSPSQSLHAATDRTAPISSGVPVSAICGGHATPITTAVVSRHAACRAERTSCVIRARNALAVQGIPLLPLSCRQRARRGFAHAAPVA